MSRERRECKRNRKKAPSQENYKPAQTQERQARLTAYFYCIRLSTLMKPSWRQPVTCFVVISTCKLDALQPTLALAIDSGWAVAATSTAQMLRESFAYLGNGDRRSPFFSPVGLPTPRTNWPSGKA